METSLLRQVSDLKEELGQISMADEFAKYSKIKRKLNKASDELNSKSKLQTFSWFFKLIFNERCVYFQAETR